MNIGYKTIFPSARLTDESLQKIIQHLTGSIAIVDLTPKKNRGYNIPSHVNYYQAIIYGGKYNIDQTVHAIENARRLILQLHEQSIIVHCHHGLNRTGAVVCSLLLSTKTSDSIQNASILFKQHRSQSITRPIIFTILDKWYNLFISFGSARKKIKYFSIINACNHKTKSHIVSKQK